MGGRIGIGWEGGAGGARHRAHRKECRARGRPARFVGWDQGWMTVATTSMGGCRAGPVQVTRAPSSRNFLNCSMHVHFLLLGSRAEFSGHCAMHRCPTSSLPVLHTRVSVAPPPPPPPTTSTTSGSGSGSGSGLKRQFGHNKTERTPISMVYRAVHMMSGTVVTLVTGSKQRTEGE